MNRFIRFGALKSAARFNRRRRRQLDCIAMPACHWAALLLMIFIAVPSISVAQAVDEDVSADVASAQTEVKAEGEVDATESSDTEAEPGEEKTESVEAEVATETKPELTPEQLKAKTKELLQQLESRDDADRTAAENELIELGPAILGELPNVTVDTSEEMRARLNRVRKRLEQAAAESMLQASRVTLDGEMLLSEALVELEKQTENKLIDFRDQFDQPQLDPKVKLELKDEAYWTALNSILEQAGLQLYAYTNEPNTLGYVAKSDKLTPAAQAAATELFRLEVIRMQAIRDLWDAENQGLLMTVEVTWEPRLTPISISQSLADLKVTDDKGKALEAMQGRGVTNVSVQSGISAVELELPFSLPSRDVLKASIKGELSAVVPGGSMTLEFTDLDSAREDTKGSGGLSVILLRARKTNGLYDLRLLMRFGDSNDAMRMQRGWVYSNEAYLLDPNGEQVEYAGLETFRETMDEIGISYKYDVPADLKGYKFIYKSPSSVISVPVKYEIKDIELP